MPADDKVPDLFEIIRRWAYEHFGVLGLTGLALLSAVAYVWKNWDKVKTWPGVGKLVTNFSRQPVPRADPQRFAVLVAHLENDEKRENERLIIEALKEFEGVQVLALDRSMPLAGTVPEEMERRGQEKAQAFLRESGAAVLIWGMVLSRGGDTVYKLYWTPGAEAGYRSERYPAPLAETQLRLPEVFWKDLSEILRLLVVAGDEEFRGQEGHYVADRLSPFIARVRTLLQASVGRPGWDADAKGATRQILANALETLGEQSGQNQPLEEAVKVYRETLQEYTRERAPLPWAMNQNNLGNALARIGERERGTERLHEAVAAYQEALKEWTRERVPLAWAMTYNNLGNALLMLGERESGTTHLEEAVEAYRAALAVFEEAQEGYYVLRPKGTLERAEKLLRERRAAAVGGPGR